MDLRATKDRYEREQEEAERLVRPAPKLKPPRHDRQRKHVEPQEQDDIDEAKAEDDPDLSVNYKGRSATNIVARYLAAKAKQPSPKEPAPPKAGGGEKRVPVVNVSTGESTSVTEETLKAEPGKYKPIKDKTEDSAGSERFDTKEPPKLTPRPMPDDQAWEPASIPGSGGEGFVPNPKAPQKPAETPAQAPAAKPADKPAEAPPEGKAAEPKAIADKLDQLVQSDDLSPEDIASLRKDISKAKTDLSAPKSMERLEETLGLPGISFEALEKALDENPSLGKKKPAEDKLPAKPDAEPAEDPAVEAVMKRLETDDKLRTRLGLPPAKAKPEADKKPAEGEKAKAAKPEKDKLGPEDRAELDEWAKSDGPESPAFDKFVGGIKTVRRKGDQNLFLDAKGKHVEFDALSDAEKLDWKRKFETVDRQGKHVEGIKPLSRDNPQFKQLLRDLTDPKSAVSQSLAQEGKPEHLDLVKALPQLKGIKLPEGMDTVSDLMSAAKEVNKPLPTPQRREVSNEEQGAANYELKQTFPKSVAEALIEARTHPDDIRDIVDSYHKAREQAPREDLGSFLARVTPFYQPNPNKIEPPKTGTNEAGKQVPWEKLDPEEQAESMARHRNKVVALSMAARAHTATEFMNKTKAPAALASKLADFTLNRPEGETPDQRHKRAEMMAQDMFQKAMTSGDEPEEMSDRDIKRAMDLIAKDPAAQTVAVGFLQAHDYQLVRQKFLGAQSDDAISEHDSPSKIFKGIQKAVNFLRDRTKLYPAGTASQDTPGMFRARVLDRLRTLEPDKHREVREQVNEAAVGEYESALKDWNTATQKYDAKYQKLKDKCEAMGGDACDPEKPSKKTKAPSGSPYRDAPPEAKAAPAKPNKKLDRLQEELATLTARAPKEPVPPPGYTPPSGKRHGEKGTIWDEVKLASRVASRYVFSTCTHGNAMDRASSQNRQGVYWGVAPVQGAPYPEWSQAHQRDLGKRDYDGLLTAARGWLKTPVLSTSMEGVVRDTQVRAALDLAVRTHEEGRYSVGLHPTVYNYLLAKLAGESADETLLTVRTADKSVYAATGERTAMNLPDSLQAAASKALRDTVSAIGWKVRDEWSAADAFGFELISEDTSTFKLFIRPERLDEGETIRVITDIYINGSSAQNAVADAAIKGLSGTGDEAWVLGVLKDVPAKALAGVKAAWDKNYNENQVVARLMKVADDVRDNFNALASKLGWTATRHMSTTSMGKGMYQVPALYGDLDVSGLSYPGDKTDPKQVAKARDLLKKAIKAQSDKGVEVILDGRSSVSRYQLALPLRIQLIDIKLAYTTGERTAMKPSAHIRAYAAKIASTNPEIAFDLANLSAKIAADEKEEKKDQDKDKDEDKGKPFPGAAKPFGKDAQADDDKKQSQDEPKKDEPKDQGQKQAADDADKKQSQDEPKKDEPKEQQAKEAYLALRSACIRTASTSPQARLALTPVLQLIKQIG